MFLLTPFCLDDYLFRFYWNEAHHNVWNYVSMIRFEENGRAGNLLFPLFDNTLCWPVWKSVFALITSAMIVGMGYMVHKTTHKNLAASLTAVWVISILLPWRARLFISDYFLNYIPASLLSLALIWLFIYPPKHPRPFWCALLAVLTGLQHEALTATLCVGLLTLFILRRFRFSSLQWLMTLSFMAGAAIQLSSPGLWLKLNAWESFFTIKDFLQAFPAVLLLVISLPLLLNRRCRPLTHNTLFILCTVMALTALVFTVPIGFKNARATWFQQLFAIIALSQIYISLLSPSNRVAILITTLYTVFWCAIINLQHRFYISNQEIEAQLSSNKIAYAELPQKKPKWALFFPQQSIWTEPTHITMVNFNDTIAPKAVVPPVLRYFNLEELKPVPGTAEAVEFRGVYLLPHRRPLIRIDAHGYPAHDIIECTTLDMFTETDTLRSLPVAIQKIYLPGFGPYNLVRPAHYNYENRNYIRIDTVK